MKKFLMALTISIIGLTLGMTSVEAKRLGGGGSFGKSSPSYSRQAPMQNGQAAAPARPQPAAPAAAPSRMPQCVCARISVSECLPQETTTSIEHTHPQRS